MQIDQTALMGILNELKEFAGKAYDKKDLGSLASIQIVLQDLLYIDGHRASNMKEVVSGFPMTLRGIISIFGKDDVYIPGGGILFAESHTGYGSRIYLFHDQAPWGYYKLNAVYKEER